jgi:N-acetylneuraminic acid mutarotase
VIVAGGADRAFQPISSAELYNPATGTWMPAGSLNTARTAYASALLSNGKVLVTGGFGADFHALAGAELYDPATGIWTTTTSMTVRRFNHVAVLLPDGMVLVSGGKDETGIPICNSEVYDPATDNWSVVGALNEGRTDFTATLLTDGKVLTVGGQGLSEVLGSTEVYDRTTRTWTATGRLSTPRDGSTASLLPDGKVLMAGGEDFASDHLSTAELYDPDTGAWSLTGAMSAPRSRHTATLLRNGTVMVAGGLGGSSPNNAVARVELYDPATGSWTTTGSLLNGRVDHGAALLRDGKVLVAGGHIGFDTNVVAVITATAELFDPATGTWAPTGAMGTNRSGFSMTLLPNGQVLIAGGGNSNGLIAGAELYDPATARWTPTGPLRAPRAGHTATLLPNGKVLVAGGSEPDAKPQTDTFSSAELYDPATGTWSPTGAMIERRAGHTATVLPSGEVLVAGGGLQLVSTFTTTAELYDPATETWTATIPVIIGEQGQTATLLRSGKVLIAGGSNQADADGTITELFDLAGDTASTNSPPTVAITSPTAGNFFIAPATVTLQAEARDGDGSVTNVQFFDGATSLGNVSSTPYNLSLIFGVGTHALFAIASDDLGVTTVSLPVIVTVTANSPPTVTITSPTDGTSFIAPAAITLQAAASDRDGSVSNVLLFDGATSLGNVSSSPYNLSVTLLVGSHALIAVASDNLGVTTTSLPVTVIVTDNKSPTYRRHHQPSRWGLFFSSSGNELPFKQRPTTCDGSVATSSSSMEPPPGQCVLYSL